MRATLAFLCLIVFGAGPSFAQATIGPPGVKVSAVFGDSGGEPFERQVADLFRAQLRAQGYPEEGRHQVTLLIDALPTDDGGHVVLSVTTLMNLPAEVVDLGAREEAFYLRLARADLPEEGK
jgi:hypothetical protein